MRRETEFVRPELAFERDFLQLRNWWVQDKRIVGNPASIFFYLLAHRANFRVTQSKVMRDLGLGKDAYLTARRKLEAAGYLEVVVHRYAPGEVDENGVSIGGQKWTELIVCDPEPPAELRTLVKRQAATAAHEGSASEAPTGKGEPLADNPPRLAEAVQGVHPDPLAGNPPRVSEVGSASLEIGEVPRDSGAEALEGNPAPGFPPPIQDQEKQNSSSSSVLNVRSEARALEPASPDDDDSERAWFDQWTADCLARLDDRLDLRELVDRLHRNHRDVAVEILDLPRAADDILGAAPRRVGNPVAYVARSLAAEPWRWVRTDAIDGLGFADANPSAQPTSAAGRPPTLVECASSGHRWVGQFAESCTGCGAERPDWRDDRDRALAHRLTTTEGMTR